MLEEAEKPGNDVEEKSLSGDEEKLAAGTCWWLFALDLEGSAVLSSFSPGGSISSFFVFILGLVFFFNHEKLTLRKGRVKCLCWECFPWNKYMAGCSNK